VSFGRTVASGHLYPDGSANCCAFVNEHVIAGDTLGRAHFLRIEEPQPKNRAARSLNIGPKPA